MKKLSDCCAQFLLGDGIHGEADVTNITLANEGSKLRVTSDIFSGHIRRHMHRRLTLMAYVAKHITPVAQDNSIRSP